jgi:hypothetical protein
VVWLSGYAHTNDKLAMKEIGRQLVLQTGSNDLGIPDHDDGDSEDEFETDKGSAGLAHLNSILVCPILVFFNEAVYVFFFDDMFQ